ncbi:serine/threonine-protein kinase PknK [Pyxidicoccus trucidator]|uniref:serine/threonine-protein kinase n=1 Tax=Pyxidicoccus trucidator TaxID=2709662 RepID=UPI0013D93D62|nr:serine/threonine-protein kinase [Pyxidicoccus trucidator]
MLRAPMTAPAWLHSLPGVGETLGPYRLLEVLGQGGMGVVYRGEHPDTGEAVAVKTVRAASEVPLASIRREIHALRRLRHAGVVRIVAEGVTDGLPWYAMELLRGQTLRGASAGQEAGPVGPERLRAVLTLVRRMCAPLAFLHANGLVHRDLKPENVFLRPDGTPVLVDFGIAASFGGSRGRETLDVGGTVVGSDAYMAPEQLRGGFVDARADLYALGCIFYELLTGRPPFLPGREGPVPHQHLHVAPVPPSRRVEGLSEAVDALALRLLAKKPPERPGYAEDVAAALDALGAEGGGDGGDTAPRTPAYLYRPDLAGRGGELGRLMDALDAASRGQGGRVFLGGESGAGKTRLALELASEATWRRMAVVTGECVPLDAGGADVHAAPLQPLRPLLLAVADRCNERGAEEADRLLGPRGRVLAAYEPSLTQLPGQGAQPEPPPLPAPEARARVLAALRDTLRAFAEVQPLLLVLDDLQWADELTLSFLQELGAAHLASRPVLLVGTYRMDQMDAELRAVVGAPDAVRVEVGRLDAASAGEMVRGMLALREVPGPFVDALVRETSGNPFFIAEYLRAAIDAGLLFRAPSGEWLFEAGGSAGTRPLPLPGSIVELIERRLADLGAEGRALAEAASVLGREQDAELLLATAALSEAAGLEAVEELRRRQVLEESGSGRLRFVHDKLREVAYARIPAGPRQALHLRSAKLLERRYMGTPELEGQAAALGHHWSRAGVPARASGWLAHAGDRARAAYANGDAIAFYEAALREVAASGGNADASPGNAEPPGVGSGALAVDRVWEGLGEVLALTGRQAEARSAFMEALARIPQSERVHRANVLRKVGKALQTHHQNEEALRVYARAEAELGPAPGLGSSAPGESEAAWWHEWVQLQGERITVHYWLAQLDAMKALVEGVRPVVQTHGTPLQRARFFNSLVQMQLRSERYQASAETMAHARAYAEAAMEAGGDPERAGARCVLATVLLFHGVLDEARAEMELSLREAERLGDVTLQTRCLTYLTVILRRLGQVDATREAAGRSLEVASTARMADYVGAAHANRAWVALRAGDRAQAREAGTEALRLWQPLSLVYPFQWLAHWPLMSVELDEGRLPEALGHARAMLATSQQRLPDTLSAPLAAAVAEEASAPSASEQLLLARESARRLGYL